MDKFSVFVPRLVPSDEKLVGGHRACIGCGEALAARHVLKAVDRNIIVVNATGCLEIFTSALPQTSWTMPWIHTIFENTAAVASGVEVALRVLQRKGRKEDERINVLAFAGDGGTNDIGLQALSGAMERGHDLLYCCFDNEAYMNTGIQRSSATPYGAATTTSPPGKLSIGQVSWKKNMPEIAVAHNIPYVATACPSYPFDLMEKVQRGIAAPGPAYIHILSVCPTGWRHPPDLTIKAGRLAVETAFFPLYEVVEGRYRVTVEPPLIRPVREYLDMQGRFRHLTESDRDFIQERVKREWDKLREKASGNGAHEDS
jgi:pyruvate ferredoxin oxidoreductase beta subunit